MGTRCAMAEATGHGVGLAGLALVLLASCGPADQHGGGPGRRPNLVLLIADDQDYEHLGFEGHPAAHTPALDRLAERGTVFPVAHVAAPRCRPSLASILTGRWPHQHGIFFNEGGPDAPSLDPTDALPRLLRDAGYATFLGGKHWEGNPAELGFEAADTDPGFVRDGQQRLFAFLDENAGRRPFFLWWAPLLPHWPHDAPERFREAIDPASIPIPPWLARPAWSVDPELYRAREHEVLASVAWFDAGVAELVAKLEALGEAEHTLYVYLIDNGSAHGLVSKGSPFEKGLRTPLLFSWPARVPAGERRAGLASSVDLYPTLLEYAGVAVPERVAGTSLVDVIEGRRAGVRRALFGAVYPRILREDSSSARGNVYALHARTERWKYVLYLRLLTPEVSANYRIKHELAPVLERRRGDEDLFDLAADPHELEDLAERPDLAEERRALRADVLRWWERTGGGKLRLP